MTGAALVKWMRLIVRTEWIYAWEDKEVIEMEFQRIHAAYEYLISRKRIDAGAAADGIGKVKAR